MGRIIDVGDDQHGLFAASVVSTPEAKAAFSETERTRPKTKTHGKASTRAGKASATGLSGPHGVETGSAVPPDPGNAPGGAQPVSGTTARRVPAGAWIAATLRRWETDGPDAPPVLTTDVYPCRCDDDVTDDEFAKLPQARRDAYRKEGIRPKRCNPWQVRGAVGPDGGPVWRSKCPCWGRQRDDRLPDGCCAFMDPNPAHGPRWSPMTAAASVVSITGGTEAAVDADLIADPAPDADVTEAAYTAAVQAAAQPLSATETPERAGDGVTGRPRGDARFYDALGLPLEVAATPVPASWSALDVTCECRTPWGAARTWSEHESERKGRKGAGSRSGYHCPQCHRNFKSYALAEGHQRAWTEPCRDPAVLADFMTGRPLYRLSVDVDSGLTVWGLSYSQAE
jgi:hypothetical protein